MMLVGCQRAPTPADNSGPATAFDFPKPIAALEIHNLFQVSARVFSGSSPEGDAGFAALEKLGIKTILTVDGARPDIETANRHGLRYVHLPFGYDGIPQERVVALAKAVTVLPGPIYVHCHHGKHRGPAAVAVIQLCTDPTWDAGRAEAWLKTAGTDSRYVGLISLPRSLALPTADQLAKADSAFPAVAHIPDLAALMVDVDARWDNLKFAKAAGWVAPKDHPDVDPPHEAVQISEHFREATRLNNVQQRGPDFAARLRDAEAAVANLERELKISPISPDRAEKAFDRSAAACTSCHASFRDRPRDQ